MKKLFRLYLALLMTLFTSATALASGFSIYEWSARGNALGGAMIAGGDDPSVMAYNSAAMTRLDGDSWLAGMIYINPAGRVDFEDGTSTSNVRNAAMVPCLYYVHQLDERLWFGLAELSRFGLASEFPENWKGRYSSYYAAIESASVVPSLALRVSDRLSLSLGLEAMWFQFESKRKIPGALIGMGAGTPDVNMRIKGDDMGYGWNFGLLYDLDERTSLGMTYRSELEQKVDGRATFSSNPVLKDARASGSVTLPDSLSAGISRKVGDRTRLEVDAVYTRWSTYGDLAITIDNVLGRQVAEKNWKDVWRYQLGIERRLNDRWSLQLSYVYDNSPIPDETVDYMVPTGDRQIYGLGATYEKDDLRLSLSYAYVDIDERTVNGLSNDDGRPSRIIESDSDILGLTLSWAF